MIFKKRTRQLLSAKKVELRSSSMANHAMIQSFLFFSLVTSSMNAHDRHPSSLNFICYTSTSVICACDNLATGDEHFDRFSFQIPAKSAIGAEICKCSPNNRQAYITRVASIDHVLVESLYSRQASLPLSSFYLPASIEFSHRDPHYPSNLPVNQNSTVPYWNSA
jgi:hypothetical protein